MRIGAAALAGGIFGIVGTLCFLVAFSTDYWLVARENCGSFLQPTKITPTQDKDANRTQIQFDEAATTSWPIVHHEGFFWRCMFAAEPSTQAVLVTFFTNQPGFKMCIHGYLFPLPVALGEVPDPIYDATAVFRGFWTVLIIVGLVSALTGGLLLVCGAPFISNKLYKLGGAFFIAAACLFLFMLLLFVLWMEVVDVKRYVLQERGESCPDAEVSVLYGLSFMVAVAGIPLEVLSGLLFMLVGRALRARR
ncbi:transmembrane protein 182-like isoform X1 [Girardinichthys multiradiatus]|uniref:transmembrane protein 182-like isoform X1 n=1 Tax=Girardinichthys multiradiatus TaxID=208333 RepID=UPI001FAC2E87|nr:transmembrane protein 182-like isoform X1 [Girardinichthys multiradiatus]